MVLPSTPYDVRLVGPVRIARDVEFYNARRPHSSLEDRAPDEVYFGMQLLKAAA